MKIAKEWLDFLREQYPAGSRIQLREIGSDPAPIPPGSMGTLDYIDDAGQFQISWDKGRSLALVIGADRFTVLPPEPALLKLYMPLTADFYPRDEWGDSSEEGERWDDRTLTEYEDQILGALVKNRMPEEPGTWPHALVRGAGQSERQSPLRRIHGGSSGWLSLGCSGMSGSG